MASNNNEYHETKEYNPVTGAIRKILFAFQRYFINILFLVAAIFLIIYSRSTETTQAVISIVAAVILISGVLSLRIAFEWKEYRFFDSENSGKPKVRACFLLFPL